MRFEISIRPRYIAKSFHSLLRSALVIRIKIYMYVIRQIWFMSSITHLWMSMSFYLLSPRSKTESGCVHDYFIYDNCVGVGDSLWHTNTMFGEDLQRNIELTSGYTKGPSTQGNIQNTDRLPAVFTGMTTPTTPVLLWSQRLWDYGTKYSLTTNSGIYTDGLVINKDKILPAVCPYTDMASF